MLLAWMAYAVLFGSLTYGAAFAADRIAATWERRQRFIWAGAVVVAAAVPVIFATLPRSRASGAADLASVESPGIGTNVSIAFGGAPRPPIRESLRTRAQRLVTESDAYLVGAWILGSVAWMALLARAAIDIRRRGAHWREVEVDGSSGPRCAKRGTGRRRCARSARRHSAVGTLARRAGARAHAAPRSRAYPRTRSTARVERRVRDRAVSVESRTLADPRGACGLRSRSIATRACSGRPHTAASTESSC